MVNATSEPHLNTPQRRAQEAFVGELRASLSSLAAMVRGPDSEAMAKAAISRRAGLFREAFFAAKAPELEQLPGSDLAGRLAVLRATGAEVVSEADALMWAELDAAAFRLIVDGETREEIALAMAHTRSERYLGALRSAAPDVAATVAQYCGAHDLHDLAKAVQGGASPDEVEHDEPALAGCRM